jgi:hypothetical protein
MNAIILWMDFAYINTMQLVISSTPYANNSILQICNQTFKWNLDINFDSKLFGICNKIIHTRKKVHSNFKVKVFLAFP